MDKAIIIVLFWGLLQGASAWFHRGRGSNGCEWVPSVGYCLDQHGRDQNSNTIVIPNCLISCLAKCKMAQRKFGTVTGCEQEGKVCTIHHAPVSKGNGDPRWTCWVLNCGPSTTTRPTSVITTPTSTQTTCVDRSTFCHRWARHGECAKNPDYMLSNCCESCSRAPSNECSSSPCLNGGTCCENGHQPFTCQCATGYSGHICDRIAPWNECSSSPCLNGGTCCENGHQPFTCQCATGYSGHICDRIGITTTPAPITPAPPTGCDDSNEHCAYWAENGECTKNPSYMTTNCCKSCNGDNQSPCEGNPCFNGATCYASPGGSFTCLCQIGFIGDTCTVPDPSHECLKEPCEHGSCIERGSRQFRCSCVRGYSGKFCNIRDGNSGCPRGYKGRMCNIPDPEKDCARRPCRNGGECIENGRRRFNCMCPAEFIGRKCQTRKPM